MTEARSGEHLRFNHSPIDERRSDRLGIHHPCIRRRVLLGAAVLGAGELACGASPQTTTPPGRPGDHPEPIPAELPKKGPELSLPPRRAGMSGGSAFYRKIGGLSAGEREIALREELLAGNVPPFLRRLRPIALSADIRGHVRHATAYVTPDYLAIGDDEDFVLTPLAGTTAQIVADAADALLPTRRLVDAIYEQADARLRSPRLTDPDKLTTLAYYVTHSELIRRRRDEQGIANDALVAGHKKDVVVSRRLAYEPGKLVIYGWFFEPFKPVQPLSAVHSIRYADYSHGIRLVHHHVELDGEDTTLESILNDRDLHPLASDEGRIRRARYVF